MEYNHIRRLYPVLACVLIVFVLTSWFLWTGGRHLRFINRAYNGDIALYEEYPQAGTYWMANDRFLVGLVEGWDSSVHPADGLAIYNLYDPVIEPPFNATKHHLVGDFGVGVVWNEVATSEIMDDWDDYADLLVYGILYYNAHNNTELVEAYYDTLISLWDGNGFTDKAFDGEYQTYKCALYIIVTDKIMVSDPVIRERCRYNLNLAGLYYGGGYQTGYTIDGELQTPTGMRDVETTCLCIMALRLWR